jgi:hypothetical protein
MSKPTLCVSGIRAAKEGEWEKFEEEYNDDDAANLEFHFQNEQNLDRSTVIVGLENHECCSGFEAYYQEGFDIDLTKLPEGITKIRVYKQYHC